ncbi:MAG TPA: peptide ABC transporter substrate-binding protein [Pyrinomonadaceae bacterium]|nr:peptide ABC transporter substrate-binding protein [Pyrinomonadaceae bacterium]
MAFRKKEQWLFNRHKNWRSLVLFVLFLALALTHVGCFGEETPATYYGRVLVPRAQEFRWSDGGIPQTFDPAFAAAPPDTDAVRALFEGLTDYDSKTLQPVPGVATRWESASDNRIWTFYLREDARWSNGERVTASDFVRSWERTFRIGPLAPHTELLANIESTPPAIPNKEPEATASTSSFPATARLGLEAIGDNVLRVHLRRSDPSFPSLVAHPVFRPVKIAESTETRRLEPVDLVFNGAFQLAATQPDRVLLERAKTYWDGASVSLQRVAFVNSPNAELALAAYHSGEIDAVTSAAFEPLALKLLAPYKDFRRSTFGALTYYSFNTSKAPFDDVRVREALAISIDRERVSRNDLGGATEAAGKFLPPQMSGAEPVVAKTDLLEQDAERARSLLAAAGYPNGEGFPVIRLLINRNEQQRIVAQSIASMWLTTLGIQCEIVIKNWDEYEAALKAGDYDIVRRGVVMQTADELTNLRLLFPIDRPLGTNANLNNSSTNTSAPVTGKREVPSIESESQALKELKAMPIYFASAYSLVKPYVSGFDANVLDAPSLKRTSINTNWTQPKP